MSVRPARLVAHTPSAGSNEWHYLDDHSMEVARLAAEFAKPFGGELLARPLGFNHDAGKAHNSMQEYLWQCFLEPERKHQTVDHKAAGTMRIQTVGGEPLMQIVNGHHGGMLDVCDLNVRINSIIENDQERIQETLGAFDVLDLAGYADSMESAEPPAWFSGDDLELEFLCRMLFSCLVDADALDTEAHWNPEAAMVRNEPPPALAELWQRLEENQKQFSDSDAEKLTEVNRVRADVYAACLEKAKLPQGFFRLTVPTGGGKTRSGLAFALRHALCHDLSRIIVAVPFTTITDQTARVFREALGGTHAVLEHHSSIEPTPTDPDGSEAPLEIWRKLASQNWDAPVIVTTTVQLFESLFSNKTSKCRKLHRLAKSVIILDEAQTIPAHLRGPIFDALRELVTNYGVTVVLSTATQPVLDTIASQLDVGNRGVTEIAPDPRRLFSVLKRVEYELPCLQETWSWERVAEEMRSQEQVMTIVNTKADAISLFKELDDSDALHLSTQMCGAHRRDVLSDIRRRLDAKLPCRVVSTQLVEAGVDLDFPMVMRAIGPLDRIVQAAGRCNREGKLTGLGRVIVFSAETDSKMPKGTYKRGSDEAMVMLSRGNLDLDDPDVFLQYFSQLYGGESEDRPNIQQNRAKRNYATVSSDFNMIDDNSFSVLVRYSKSPNLQDQDKDPTDELIETLRWSTKAKGRPVRHLLQRAQPFIVNCRNYREREYEASGLIVEIVPGIWEWKGEYDRNLGLDDARIAFRSLVDW